MATEPGNDSRSTGTDASRNAVAASVRDLPSEVDQQKFWNDWNATYRGAGLETKLDPATVRRRDTVLEWVRELGINTPRILDVGCATGWLTAQLAQFGEAMGTDIADASIREARDRYPGIAFECTDLSNSDSMKGAFDIVVSLETLSHVPDQAAFVSTIGQVLKPGGYLLLTTQNRFVFERRGDVGPPGPGQIRHWLSTGELRELLQKDFAIKRLTTLMPEGHLGILRLLNSYRLNDVLLRLKLLPMIDRARERLGLGQTIAVLAQRRG